MRIGLFSDTYRPTINGITYVVDTLKTELEALGHEVYVFCPARTLRPSKKTLGLDFETGRIVRLPSFPSGFFDDFDFTLFFPPLILKQIRDMELDIIHVFTPSQVGLLGINAAVRYDVPLVVQHCTDLYEFSENYPNVLPGALALVGIVFPMSVKLEGKDIREIIKLHRPRSKVTKWNRDIISKAMTILYSKADAAIALSRKSYAQLKKWQGRDYPYEITLLPNGVNALPKPTEKQLSAFRERWGLSKKDEVYGFVGRLGEEKNLPVLIRAFDKIGRERPHAKLLFVGDFEYRKTLEAMAAQSKYPDRIIFTGFIQREQLGVAYAALDVFVFPSLKDTQGWVLHEAAHAGLPLILIDRDLSEVMRHGENGYFARNNATDVARQVVALLRSPAKREKFGTRSKELARVYTQKKQTKKLEALYEDVIARYETRELPSTRTRFKLAVKKFVEKL
jgi:glycosyltransferase involved in cell wall biosynthesis